MSDRFSINPASRGVNNFFESLTNSSNPTYIQPIQQPSYVPPPQPVYSPPARSSVFDSLPAQKIYPLPTVTYTPPGLRDHFKPLNDSYTNEYYGKQ